MAGEFKGYHRLRIGSFRVLFVVDNTTQTIYIDHIGSRGDVEQKDEVHLTLLISVAPDGYVKQVE